MWARPLPCVVIMTGSLHRRVLRSGIEDLEMKLVAVGGRHITAMYMRPFPTTT